MAYIYVVTDCEFDGPVPGAHSMLSFGSVALSETDEEDRERSEMHHRGTSAGELVEGMNDGAISAFSLDDTPDADM